MGMVIMVLLERFRNNEICYIHVVFMELLVARISGRRSRKELFSLRPD